MLTPVTVKKTSTPEFGFPKTSVTVAVTQCDVLTSFVPVGGSTVTSAGEPARTVIVSVPELERWIDVRAGSYVALIVYAPAPVELNSMMHDVLAAELGARTHGLGSTTGVEPAGWLVNTKLTVPLGGLFVPVSVSDTVTLQVAGMPATVDGGQLSVVDVERAMTVIVSVPVLVSWIDAGAGS